MKLEEVVKNLIMKNKISTQSELVERLERLNKSVTQSNLSRVLKKINAIKKVDEHGRDYYVVEHEKIKISDPISNLVQEIEDNNNIIVVKTYAGAGHLIGQIIENTKSDNVLGIACSHSSVMIAPQNVVRIKTLKNELINLLSK